MNANLPKRKNYHESPHIVIRQSLHLIVENSVILKNPTVSDDGSLQRQISYEIEKIGKNVKIHMKNKKYRNVKLDETVRKRIYILVSLQSVKNMPGLIFFDELGKRLDSKDLETKKKGHVLLAMAEKSEKVLKLGTFINSEDVKLANKLWVNQIKTDGSFHFDTSGKIFGLGFGPKYFVDEQTNLSIGQFAGKKKKISSEDMTAQLALKKKKF